MKKYLLTDIVPVVSVHICYSMAFNDWIEFMYNGVILYSLFESVRWLAVHNCLSASHNKTIERTVGSRILGQIDL